MTLGVKPHHPGTAARGQAMDMSGQLDPSARHGVLVLLTLYLATLAGIGFWPTALDRPLASFVNDVLSALPGNALTGGIDYKYVESVANAVLFVPLGLLGALLVPARRWGMAALAGLPASAAIETIQFLLLSQRSASVRDVATNTLGAVLGAAVIRLAYIRRGRSSMPITVPGCSCRP